MNVFTTVFLLFLTWLSKFMCSSNVTPRFRALRLVVRSVAPMLMYWVVSSFRKRGVEKSKNYVLSSFSWSLLSSIHDLISEIHAWMVSLATCSPVLEDVSKAIKQAIAASDVNNWCGVYGEQFGAQYRALGCPILDFNRWLLDVININEIL